MLVLCATRYDDTNRCYLLVSFLEEKKRRGSNKKPGNKKDKISQLSNGAQGRSVFLVRCRNNWEQKELGQDHRHFVIGV